MATQRRSPNGDGGSMNGKPPMPEDMTDKTIHDLFEPRFITPIDIGEQSRIAEVERVMMEPIANLQSRKWMRISVVYFKGMERGLKLPKTQGQVLQSLFGIRISDWIGKQVRLIPVEENYFVKTITSFVSVMRRSAKQHLRKRRARRQKRLCI